MKIEVRDDYTIQLEEVFNGVVIKTTDGVEFHICQRDYGIEVTCNGKTKYLEEETFNTKENMKEGTTTSNIDLDDYATFKTPNYVGAYRLGTYHYNLTHKPNWFHRTMMRLCFGYKWVNF